MLGIQGYFREQLGIPVSEGSIYNFNQEAYGLLATFEEKVRVKLAGADLLHVDETGIKQGVACLIITIFLRELRKSG